MKKMKNSVIATIRPLVLIMAFYGASVLISCKEAARTEK